VKNPFRRCRTKRQELLYQIDFKLHFLVKGIQRLMAQAADFVAVAATLTTEITELSTAVTAAVDEIKALVAGAGTGGVNPADLDAPLASLSAAATALQATTDALKAAPPAPTPPPPAG